MVKCKVVIWHDSILSIKNFILKEYLMAWENVHGILKEKWPSLCKMWVDICIAFHMKK